MINFLMIALSKISNNLSLLLCKIHYAPTS